jgi:putative hydrolase of the HAD superfamily
MDDGRQTPDRLDWSCILIEAITFDFWNTLFVAQYQTSSRLRCQQIKHALERAGYTVISEARIEQAISHTWQEWNRIWEQDQRTFGAEHWVRVLLADLGVKLPQPERERLIETMATLGIEVNPPLVDGVTIVLPRLAQRYRLGVICDTGLSPGWMLREWMERDGILGYFAHLTFSDELGVSKPHPDAFLTTLAALGVAPEVAVHIGDYPRTDIAGAQGVGMRAIRFAGVYDWDDGAVLADAEIASYDELEPLLNEWAT